MCAKVLFTLMLLWTLPICVAGDYFPLHVGDEWKMTATLITVKGEKFEGLLNRSVERSEMREGKTWFRMRMKTEGLPIPINFTMLYRKDSKGIYGIYEPLRNLDIRWSVVEPLPAETPESEKLLFGLPLLTGAIFNHRAGENAMTCSVVGVENVLIGGKTYIDCFHLRRSGANGYQEDDWQAAGIGAVKISKRFPNSHTQDYYLKEFKAADKKTR